MSGSNAATEKPSEFGAMVALATDIEKAAESLTPAERQMYTDAQRSVVEARRHAEGGLVDAH